VAGVIENKMKASIESPLTSETCSLKNTSERDNAAGTKRKKDQKGIIRKSLSSHECPIFLRKTYCMVDSCNPTIASWSEDGETFIVKDSDRFAAEIIPQYFKHSNFSSFVRQLNFYGFRKIKTDLIKIDPKMDEMEAKYWRFHHDKFIKGRPDLLSDIRRTNQGVVPDQIEVNALKSEYSTLKKTVATMTSDINKLTSLVKNMMQDKKSGAIQLDDNGIIGQKRKMHPTNISVSDPNPDSVQKAQPSSIAMFSYGHPLPYHPVESDNDNLKSASSTLPQIASASDADLLMVEPKSFITSRINHKNLEDNPKHSSAPCQQESFSSIISCDVDCVESMLEGVETGAALLNIETHVNSFDDISSSNVTDEYVTEDEKSTNCLDPKILERLFSCLSKLPKEMQELVVERLVTNVTCPNSMQNHIQSVSEVAEAFAVVEDLCKRECEGQPSGKDILSGDLNTPQSSKDSILNKKELEPSTKLTVPLVAAALSSFLSKYGFTIKKQECHTTSHPSVVPIKV